jgi:transposase
MDGFTGFKTAAAEELPDAVAVMDRFHVVRLAGDALDIADVASRTISPATADGPATRSTGPGGSCTPAPTCSPTRSADASARYSAPMSVSRSRPSGPSISA